MATRTPTYAQMKQAFIDYGVRFTEMSGCTTIGRPWDDNNPLVGHVHHHTATPSATGDEGAPSLEWLMTAFSRPAANCLVGRDGMVYICSWGSCFHSGNGGPWPSRGLGVGNTGHYRLWGTEIDDPGKGQTITAAQIESVGRMDAALMALCGWDKYALVNHADWTDAGPWLMNPQGQPDGGYGPYRYRKNDTLREYYSADFWRSNAEKYVKKPAGPALPVVSVRGVRRRLWKDVRQVQIALNKEYKAGIVIDGKWGPKTDEVYKRWQTALNVPANGIPNLYQLKRLGDKHKVFRAVP